MKLINVEDLPEGTIEEIREKINCYQAEAIDFRHRARSLQAQADRNDIHTSLLMQKLREAILAKNAARAGKKGKTS